MRIAIIDLGTNSVRFDIHQMGPGKRQVRELHREKIMVRLGQGAFLNGKLDRGAIRRTLLAFTHFKKLSEQYKADKIIAFGTSALREVSDREKFLKTILENTGIHVRVISGAEEAQLIALGVLSNEKKQKGKFALVDIGGGSTEVSICRGKEILHASSFPLGTARLQEVYLKKIPPALGSVYELRHHIRGAISSVILPEHWPKVDRILGSSGTIRSLGRIIGNGVGRQFTRSDLSNLVEQMHTMNTTELLGIDQIDPKRIDMILAGAILYEECMTLLGAKKSVCTEFSLRDGILEEELKLYEQGSSSHLALHLPGLREKAIQFGANPMHLDRIMAMGDLIFDRLQSVHKLKPSLKLYLRSAILLRDTGEAISYAGHEKHSYYIVKNADFPAADAWEINLIAELCRYHESSKVDFNDLGFTKNRREIFIKLLALLRIVDALDQGSDRRVRIRSIKVDRREVKIRYSGKGLTGLEGMEVEKRANYFERVMGRWISAERVR